MTGPSVRTSGTEAFQKEPNKVRDNDKERLVLIKESREYRKEGKFELLLHPTRS